MWPALHEPLPDPSPALAPLAARQLSRRDRSILELALNKLAACAFHFDAAVRALREATEERIPGGRVYLLGHDMRLGRDLRLGRNSDLFFRIGDSVLWKGPYPKLDLGGGLKPHEEQIHWYVSYASMDALDSMAWQLATGSDSIEGNPFVPLVRLYAAGFYPFSLGPSEAVLFAFEGPQRSPTAF